MEKKWQKNNLPRDTRNSVRTPSYNNDAEKALLGSILINPSSLHEVIDYVTPDSFFAEKHEHIFRAMLEILSKGEPIDVISITDKLEEKNNLEKVGGSSYIALLASEVPASLNAVHYAKIIQKHFMLRQLVQTGEHIAELGFDITEKTAEELIDEAEQSVFSLSNVRGGDKKFVSLKKTLTETWEHLEKLQGDKSGIRGVPSGFSGLDSLLSGFRKSDLIILAARPSVGKTTLALDFARYAAVNSSVPVAIFSLEMSSQQIAQRMLAAHAKVNSWRLNTGRSTDQEFGLLANALDELSKAPIYIDDQAGNSVIRMRSIARRMKAEHNIGLIIIDYLQLMTATRNYDNMVNQVTEISRSLKGLARELDLPVIALSQLSRAVESRGGKPRLSDLRDSGSIEQDADVVMFIHREDKMGSRTDNDSTGIAEILVEKHRNGPIGKVDLHFDEKTTSFIPVDPRYTNVEGEALSASQAFDAL